MERAAPRLAASELSHIAGRAALGLLIGWGYIAAILWLDLFGLARLSFETPQGSVALAEVAVVVGVAFGCVGAHVGWRNVAGEQAVREARAAMEARVAAIRAARGRR